VSPADSRVLIGISYDVYLDQEEGEKESKDELKR
jgi:hypothetical protein